MPKSIKNSYFTIGIDVVCAEKGASEMILGVSKFIDELYDGNNSLRFNLYGPKQCVEDVLVNFPNVAERSTVIDSPDVIAPDIKPSFALRYLKNSPVHHAVRDISEGKCDAFVSCGNTGALMAISRSVLKMLPGIARPAIVLGVRFAEKVLTFLDLGANSEVNADDLISFAQMGMAFSKVVFSVPEPKFAFLNIGTEDEKGPMTLREANALLKQNPKYQDSYIGYIEPFGVFDGAVDVVVTDGFTGNIFLKSFEAMANLLSAKLVSYKPKGNESSSGEFANEFLAMLKNTVLNVNHKEHNGCMFVGLNGVVMKSHGSSDAITFAYAIRNAYSVVVNRMNEKICSEIVVEA